MGELIDDRYALVQINVLLDTRPAAAVDGPKDIPSYILPYLKLVSLRPHLPLVHDYFPSSDEELDLSIWLLDYESIPLNELSEPLYPELLPTIATVWPTASALQQLTWLWQLASLWQPLQGQGVVSSLLRPEFLKINGAQVQLRELCLDEHQFHQPKHLAPVWSPWLHQTQPVIADFCRTLLKNLEQGTILHGGQLLNTLEKGIVQLTSQYHYTYQIYTATDPGPTREHNEDACYPPAPHLQDGNQPITTLTIVCDGVGGQDNGEVASQWVVNNLPLAIAAESSLGGRNTGTIPLQIVQSCLEKVNDQLNTRNNQEHRQTRERMGTTLVMGFAQNENFYLANVGDSRCYWITPDSCLQVTVDDDLATREVRLGYMLYRDALRLPRSGALTQVIGLEPSQRIHPVVQRLLVPQQSLFLLCSDGLCDYNRVDQYWQEIITPLFRDEQTLTAVGDHLIELANEVNGHDNVTVALIHCQITAPETEIVPVTYPLSDAAAKRTQPPANEVMPPEPAPQAETDPSEVPAPLPPLPNFVEPPPSPLVSVKISPWLVALVAILLVFGLVIAFYPRSNSDPTPTPTNVPTP